MLMSSCRSKSSSLPGDMVSSVGVFFLTLRLSLSRFSLCYGRGVHFAALEVVVLEVHVVFFFLDLGHLAELVHVQLADERGQVFVAEVVR